jgi:hypothetical protein
MTGARFVTPLRTEKIGAQRWMLTVLWAIAPKVDVYDHAAVIHDAAYGNVLEVIVTTGDRQRVHLIKPYADNVFREACLAQGVSGFRAWSMYQMVKLFGNPDAHPLATTHYPNVSLVDTDGLRLVIS